MGDRIFRTPAGRGNIWQRTKRRKKPRKIAGITACQLGTASGSEQAEVFCVKGWIVPRRMMERIPSSIKEKAQISMDPKAMGVKIRRRTRRICISLLNMVVRSLIMDTI